MSIPIGKDFKEIFSANLKRWRGDMSPAAAARKLGLKPATYWRYEEGKREPSASDLFFIAQKIGVSMDALVSFQMEIPPRREPVIEDAFRQIIREELLRYGLIEDAAAKTVLAVVNHLQDPGQR